MRVLLTGANGQLGLELRRVLAGEELILMDQPDHELTDPGIGEQVAAQQPNIVIHAGACTDVEACERDAEMAFRINAEGTRRVAEGAAKAGARLVYLSTDYVFDGMKTEPYVEPDPVNPLNAYGRSKLCGEAEARAICPNALIVRTSWLYSAYGKNFANTILKLSSTQTEIPVVRDQRGSPTYARDLAGMIVELIRRKIAGLIHVGGEGEASWHEFAEAILRMAASPTRAVAISTDRAGRLAARPRYSVLSTGLLRENGLTLPPWRDGLKRFMADRVSMMDRAETARVGSEG
jgi:dTDP-4-dehydrorhamnose reductase